jgi:hypothetical protein
MPPLTLSHSTSTVPLNRAGSTGVSATIRVVYSAVSEGVTCQQPSALNSEVGVYEVAVPETKNSSAT